ncbi:hypothetical protein QBC47DRAFT_302966, partial [Echria macrotheca]
EDKATHIIKQLEVRPITREQLVTEVKGIYAGLVMAENKCIEIDSQNPSRNPDNTTNEQWQSLIAQHRKLLYEHHDFFLASQHPSASPALRKLASKYAISARMWRYSIHNLLELLRHHLPASIEHILSFIYLAYSIITVLYETVPAFQETWEECLGDLSRYRMAIEVDNTRDYKIWTGVSRDWYSKASDKVPTTGRLYHHLAIVTRPHVLQQLFYYGKSLCVPIPFHPGRDSVAKFFETNMALYANDRLAPCEHSFVVINGILFSGTKFEKLKSATRDFIGGLNTYINHSADSGFYIGISICHALLGYGNETNPVSKAFRRKKAAVEHYGLDNAAARVKTSDAVPQDQQNALSFAIAAHSAVLERGGDPTTLAYIHVTLVFMRHVVSFPELKYLAYHFPWKLISRLLNTLIHDQSKCVFETEKFPSTENGERLGPLAEDYAMRGHDWADCYFPGDWFSSECEGGERKATTDSIAEKRRIRILALGYQIARQNQYLRYDKHTRHFTVVSEYEISIPGHVVPAYI